MPEDIIGLPNKGSSSMRTKAAEISQKLVDEGKIYDDKAIQEATTVSNTPYQGIESYYAPKDYHAFDDYESYIDQGTLKGGQFSIGQLNDIRAENQSKWDQTGNALGRIALNVVPQAVAAIASSFDIEGYFNAEHAANNEIVKWADSLKKTVDQDLLPIYEDNPNKSMQLGDFAWWMSRGSSLVESMAAFAASGMVAGGAATKLVSGIGKLSGGAALSRAILGAEKSKTLLQGATTLTTAAMMNQSEAVMEATQVYQTTFDNSLSKGLSVTDAKKKAAQAAATTMNINRVNILLNLTSAGHFLKPQSFIDNLIKAPSKFGTREMLKESVQEGAEETINLIAQKAGEARGRGEKDYIAQGLRAPLSMEGVEAAFLGAIGGAGQTGITHAMRNSKYGLGSTKNDDGTRTSAYDQELNRYTKQQTVIEELKQQGVKVTDALMNLDQQMVFEEKMAQASRRGDAAEVESLRNQMFEVQAMKAFSSGTTSILKDLYKNETERDPAEVGEEHISRAKEALTRLKELGSIYSNYEGYANVDEIFFNRANKQRLEQTLKNAEGQSRGSELSYREKVAEISKKYNFTENKTSTIKEEGVVKETFDTEYQKSLPYFFGDLERNPGDTEANKETYNKFLAEVKATEEYKNHNAISQGVEAANKQNAQLDKEFNQYTSKKYQETYKEEQTAKQKLKDLKSSVNLATSIDEVKNLMKESEDPDFQAIAAVKLQDLEKQIAIANKQKKISQVQTDLRKQFATADDTNLAELQTKIEDAEDLTRDQKDMLLDELGVQYRKNTNQSTQSDLDEEADNPLANFSQGEDLEEEIGQDEKDLKTDIPVDLPNPATETASVEQEVLAAAQTAVENDKTFVIGQDQNGNLIYNYAKRSEAYNVGAFLSREFTQTEVSGTVSREELTNIIDNKQVLDPDGLLAGTKLVMTVDTDYVGEKYNPSSTTRETITWTDRLAELRILAADRNTPLEQLPEYIAEVPIKITAENGETLFYLHDNAWYREENLDNTPENILADKQKNYAIRQEIIKSGGVKSKVEYKSIGRLFKTADNKAIDTSDAMPDGKLIIAVGKNGTYSFPGGKSKLIGKNSKIINKQQTEAGRPYAIVKVAPSSYIAIPLERKKVDDATINTIAFAVEGYLSQDPNNPSVKAIKDAMGLDITVASNLQKYLSHFIYLYPTEKLEGLEKIVINQGGSYSTLKQNTFLISVTPTGVEFGRVGVQMGTYRDASGIIQNSYAATISPNFNGTPEGAARNKKNLAALKASLKNALANVSLTGLTENAMVPILTDQNGTTESVNYLNFVKQNTKTNILSVNIGTDEAPKWVYTIQPTIQFSTAFADLSSAKVTATSSTMPISVAPISVSNAPNPAKQQNPNPAPTPATTAAKADAQAVKNRMQEIEKQPVLINITTDASGKMEQTSEEVVSLIKTELDKIGLPYKDIGVNDKGSTYFVITEDGKQHEILKLLKIGVALVQPSLTKAKWINHLIKTQPQDLYNFVNAELAALENNTSIEGEVGQEAVDSSIENKVDQILDFMRTMAEDNTPDIAIATIEDILLNIDAGSVPEESLTSQGFNSMQEAATVFKKAVDQFKENQSKPKSITLPNGQKIQINPNTVDDAELGDDVFDESIPTVSPTEEQISEIKSEIADQVIEGLDGALQESMLSFFTADIVKATLDAKEKDGKQKVLTAPIFQKHLDSLKDLKSFYLKNGLPNKAARIGVIIDQWEKVTFLAKQKMKLLSTGRVDENTELDENEESVGLERTSYSDDWSFTINSKATASGDLRLFLSYVPLVDENGPVMNSLGFPEMVPMDKAFELLQEMLANKPADYDLLVSILELNSEKLPWLKAVVENLENSSEKIQNEFVTTMTKHHKDLQFVMWALNKKGEYSLQRWSSNSSSKQEKIKATWINQMRNPNGQANVVITTDDGEYIFDAEVVDALTETAKEWAKNPKEVTVEDLSTWLGQLGISLSDNTYKDLKDGKYNNGGSKRWENLFTDKNSFVTVLVDNLNAAINNEITVEDAKIISDTSIKALAKLEALNNTTAYSNSFRVGSKTIFSYGNNNWLVNRMRDLTSYDQENGKFINSDLVDALSDISFSSTSLWLDALKDEDETGQAMRNIFRADYLSLEALKKQFARSRDKRKLNNLNVDEHEVTKLGMFQNSSSRMLDGKQRRIVSFFYPTMSDKTTMLTITALAQEIKMTDGELSDDTLNLLYTALVQPEIDRMRADNQAKDVKGYEPSYFYFLPGLNTLTIEALGDGKTFRDLVLAKTGAISQPDVKDEVKNYLRTFMNELIEDKLADWDSLNIGKDIKNEKGQVVQKFTYLDKTYMDKVAGKNIRFAAADFVVNYMIATAESMKLIAGDPAQYYKKSSKENATIQDHLEETFTNMGKRLAGDIAPGLELANSANNSYYQVMFQDTKMDSNNLKDSAQRDYFEKISSTYKEDYSGIEGSDAQEYTTWKEHLYVLKQLGRLTSAQYNKLTDKLTQQSKGVINKLTKLTYDEVGLVLQPMKPVYAGNTPSVKDNLDRRIYIKSSSFPLIPEFTAGLELDTIRQAIENFEESKSEETGLDGEQKFVRASFGTANKVGSTVNSLKVFNEDGTVVKGLTINDSHALELNRANFRIQQDVPYNREKDVINVGTQERKLLFVDILNQNIKPGVTGQALKTEYDTAYDELFQYKQEKLSKELGLIQEVDVNNIYADFEIMTPDSSLIDSVSAEIEEANKIKSPIKKVRAIEEISTKIGADNLERINFINKNFDQIVEALTKSKINVFFDESEQFKKCD